MIYIAQIIAIEAGTQGRINTLETRKSLLNAFEAVHAELSLQLQTVRTAPLPASQSQSAETTQFLCPNNLLLSLCVLRLIYRASSPRKARAMLHSWDLSDRPDFIVS